MYRHSMVAITYYSILLKWRFSVSARGSCLLIRRPYSTCLYSFVWCSAVTVKMMSTSQINGRRWASCPLSISYYGMENILVYTYNFVLGLGHSTKTFTSHSLLFHIPIFLNCLPYAYDYDIQNRNLNFLYFTLYCCPCFIFPLIEYKSYCTTMSLHYLLHHSNDLLHIMFEYFHIR